MNRNIEEIAEKYEALRFKKLGGRLGFYEENFKREENYEALLIAFFKQVQFKQDRDAYREKHLGFISSLKRLLVRNYWKIRCHIRFLRQKVGYAIAGSDLYD